MLRTTVLTTALLTLGFGLLPAQDSASLRAAALEAMRLAGGFCHQQLASHGGYVYYSSLDLEQRWGEGKADRDTIVVQPPGTPTVGLAFLAAHAASGEAPFLDAARDAAQALVYGQLESGGWTQTIHFSRTAKRLGRYRNGQGGDWNLSSLDDGQTQAALQLLMRVDQALDFQHAAIHEASRYGLDALLAAQFPNGAFPQVWGQAVSPQAVLAARYPDYDWRSEGRIKNYWDFYTLNDGLASSVAETLILAQQVYADVRFEAALRRLGDFLILAQMPEPQPAWCQQYNYAMNPIWARKFEPPAISGWESQDVMWTLIRIARITGEPRYLDPIPRALDYLEHCLLPDGRIPRYLELETDRPLYMDAQYRLSYDDRAAPAHYGWKQPADFAAIRQAYQAARDGIPVPAAQPPSTDALRRIIDALDQEGRWISSYQGERLVGQPNFAPGFRYLSSAVFSRNLTTLADFLATQPID